VFNHVPNSTLVFEAQIAPRIIITDSIGNATRKVFASAGAVWGRQVSATPMVKLRMFNETSNPVRTPSYMPKGTIQLARLKSLSASSDPDDRPKAPVAMWLIDVIPFGHHSNGQNGCLFTSQSRNAGGDCEEKSATPVRAINKIDGSFSTNYIEAGVHYGRMYLEPQTSDQAYGTRREWRAGVAVQLNPKGFVAGSIDDELAPLYGQTRLIVEAATARHNGWKCGRVEGQVRFQYIHDHPVGVPPVTTIAEASCLPRTWGGTGVFVRFIRGQDYYNLGFGERISRLQFGIALQQATFLSFRLAPL
jgi:hypothetical protein